MGFLDILTGRRKLAQPAEDRLFAISTAYVTFETGLEITTRGTAAIVFQSLATADFTSIVRDMEEVVSATASDSATTVDKSTDSYGYSWLILRGSDFDSLVVGINAVSGALQAGGYGDRLLCTVFAFQDGPRHGPLLDLQLQAGLLLPVRPGGLAATRQRARAGPQGPGGHRAADRARAQPVVSPLGNPGLTRVRSASE